MIASPILILAKRIYCIGKSLFTASILSWIQLLSDSSTVFTIGFKRYELRYFLSHIVDHLNQVQRTRVYNLSWENYRTYVDLSDLKTTEIHDKFFKGSIVIIHIYSLIYILLLDTLIEKGSLIFDFR